MAKAGKRADHGWWPYWFPMLSFLLLVEIGGRAPESATALFLALKVLVPAGFVVHFASRGRYPELRGYRATLPELALDVGIGLLGAVLWVTPFLLFDAMRPEDESGFDPAQLGPSLIWLALALRAVGYAVVTPFVEELFVRSWMLRFVDVFDRRQDFRDVPIAHFTWRSFLVVTAYFVLSHVPWEWGVMLVWTLLTMAWFYYRKHLAPLVIAHAVTNGSIFAFVVLCDGVFHDAEGVPIPLWFFL